MQNDYLSWRLEFETFEKGRNFNWTTRLPRKKTIFCFPTMPIFFYQNKTESFRKWNMVHGFLKQKAQVRKIYYCVN